MNKLFDEMNINSGRQIELDIARGLAVLFMIAVHILEVFSNEHIIASLYGSIIEFLGGPPAAPVFMFLLGIGIEYSTKSKPHILLKRGLIILLAGYLLNILRGSLPNLIGFIFTENNEFLQSAIKEFVSIDILQFAGLTLIYFSLVKKLKINLVIMIIMGIVFSAMNLILINIKTDHLLLSAFSGLVWGSSKISYFPFLSWIIYPIAGYFFGTFLIKCLNKSKLYLIILIFSLILFLTLGVTIVGLLNIDIGLTDEYSYYHHNIFGSMIFLSFIMLWISFLFFISKGFVGVIKTTVERWSRNVTSIYFIHWVLIGFLTIFLGMNTSNFIVTIIISIIIAAFSDILAVIYVKISGKKMHKT
ncbi:MAG: DUF1624 domain-containing protein [Spirochaetes bacterium]|nr:DUF1624 domain-containing protein [Spirochaetota bacterium]